MYLAIALEVLVAAEFWLLSTGHLGFNADIGLLTAASLALSAVQVDLLRLRRGRRLSPLPLQRRLLLAAEFVILATANALEGRHVPPRAAALGSVGLILCELVVIGFAYYRPRVLGNLDEPLSTKNLGVRFPLWAFAFIGAVVTGTAAFVSRTSVAGVSPLPVEFQWPAIAMLFATFGCVGVGVAADRSRETMGVWLVAALAAACSAFLEWNGRRNWYFLALSLISFLFLVPAWPPTHPRSDPRSASEELAQSG